MMRRTLVVGDAPVCGGSVLPYEAALSSTIHGHPVALIGGRVYCEGCHSVGIIAKAGGPRRVEFISEEALEGDVVVCHCPRPQPLVSTLQTTSYADDGAGTHAMAGPEVLAALPFSGGTAEVAAAKKTVDDNVEHPAEAEQTENICPNMTNREFCLLMMKLRDTAVNLIERDRLPELERWDKVAQARVNEWFGVVDGPIRKHLQSGLAACKHVPEGLTCANFIRYSEANKRNLGCIFPSDAPGTVAAVCKPDTATHTIAIALDFCELPEDRIVFGTNVIRDGDSKLLTLIHEVTHFEDTFSSFDPWYGTKNARNHADQPTSRTNADSLASYILGVQPKASV